MSATKKYEDLPGYRRDQETGRYIPVALNVKEFLKMDSWTRKSPRNIAGRNSTEKDSKTTERATTSRKRVYKDLPGFTRDPETGKYIAVPLDRKAFAALGIRLGPESPWLPEQPYKFRKTDAGARKELFTTPTEPPVPATRPSLLRDRGFSKKPAKKPLKKLTIPSIVVTKSSNNDLAKTLPPTPMLNEKQEFLQGPKEKAAQSDNETKIIKTQEEILKKIEMLIKQSQENAQELKEFKQILQQQGQEIKKLVATEDNPRNEELQRESPPMTDPNKRTPLTQKLSSHHPQLYKIKRVASSKPSEQISSIQEESPTQFSSQTEADLKTPDTNEFVRMEQLCLTPKNAALTPVSSVCKLFKTMDVEEENGEGEPQENPLKRRTSLFKAADDGEEMDESLKRRSSRLKKKIFNQMSPVFRKSHDLRKTTLTRSLVKKFQADSPKSPRTQKAFDMYISTKKSHNSLLTPSFSRNYPTGGQQYDNSARKRILEKLQDQCLLLQDTP